MIPINANILREIIYENKLSLVIMSLFLKTSQSICEISYMKFCYLPTVDVAAISCTLGDVSLFNFISNEIDRLEGELYLERYHKERYFTQLARRNRIGRSNDSPCKKCLNWCNIDDYDYYCYHCEKILCRPCYRKNGIEWFEHLNEIWKVCPDCHEQCKLECCDF